MPPKSPLALNTSPSVFSLSCPQVFSPRSSISLIHYLSQLRCHFHCGVGIITEERKRTCFWLTLHQVVLGQMCSSSCLWTFLKYIFLLSTPPIATLKSSKNQCCSNQNRLCLGIFRGTVCQYFLDFSFTKTKNKTKRKMSIFWYLKWNVKAVGRSSDWI